MTRMSREIEKGTRWIVALACVWTIGCMADAGSSSGEGDDDSSGTTSPLVEEVINGVPQRWSDDAKLDITYCVSDNFLQFKSFAVARMADATADWSSQTNLRFIYVPTADAGCDRNATATRLNVIWDFSYACVQPDGTTSYFKLPLTCPNGQPAPSIPSVGTPPTGDQLAGMAITHPVLIGTVSDAQRIFKHELGHALGFDHEDKQLPNCSTNFFPQSIALTAPDPMSIMSTCNPTPSSRLSALDNQGAGKLYGHIEHQTARFPNLKVLTNGSAASLFVIPGGRKVQITMTGTGNIDLYAGIGFSPTQSLFSYVSATSRSNEQLTFENGNLPFGADLFLTMYGIAGGTVSLTVNYDRLTNPNDLVARIPARTAVYQPGFLAPACLQAATSCDSGTLLRGRLNLTGGPEANGPNATDNCTDGTVGFYQSDESIESIRVESATAGPLRPGAVANVSVGVYTFSSAADELSLWYKAYLGDTFHLVGTKFPAVNGPSTLMFPVTLARGGPQTFRAAFRFTGTSTSTSVCPGGPYDDVDELTVQPAPVFNP